MTLRNILGFHDAIEELKRTKRYGNCTTPVQESVADHSYAVVSLARRVNRELMLGLDVETFTDMGEYHDLGEYGLDSDVDLTDNDQERRSGKHTLEEVAVKNLTDRYGCQEVFRVWIEYRDQQTQEAKFIKAIDKIEAMRHLISRGCGSGRKKDAGRIALQADNAVLAFPELTEILRLTKKDLKVMFTNRGIPWKKSYDKV